VADDKGVIVDLAEMEALSGEFLKILGNRILVEDPRGKHFWSDGERYYPSQFELTTPEEVHLYVRFRHGYEVKPAFGERIARLGLTPANGPVPRPQSGEIVRHIGSSDSRCERQTIFLRSLFANLQGIDIFRIPDLVSFARDHFGIPITEQAKFALLARKMQLPQTVPTKYWSYQLPDVDGVVRKSTVAIDPNRIRREIANHLKPGALDTLAARTDFPASAQ
jgi:hypothetical protein